jgi:pyruvate kinase
MLLSMCEMPEPTRAEVSDVATAVFIGVDCVMLSEETAMGKYPVDAVKTMKRIIMYSQSHPPVEAILPCEREQTVQNAISSAAINLADNISAKAIVACTKSGATAIQISMRRPRMPIVAVTNDVRACQRMSLVYGVKSYIRPADLHAAQKLTDWLRENDVLDAGDVVVTVSGQHPGTPGGTDTIKVRVLE